MRKLFIPISMILFLLTSCTPGGNDASNPSGMNGSTTSQNGTGSANSGQITDSSTIDGSGQPAASGSGSSGSASSSKSNAGTASSGNSTSTTASTPKGELDLIIEQGKQLLLDKTIFERSIVSMGDMTRLANAMKKAQRGEPVTIGVIGGSITEGAKASQPSKSYAEIFKTWWAATFSSSKTTYINAGIGSTGSLIGVHRADGDLLAHNPDVVIVEFAVNDSTDTALNEPFEGLIRKILKQPNNPAVIVLCMMEQTGKNSQANKKLVSDNYGLPMISYKDAIYPEIGKLFQWGSLASDTVHPNDTGHAITGALIKYYLTKVKSQLNTISVNVTALKAPVTSNRYENATLLTSKNFAAADLGNFKVTNNAFRQFKDGWTVKSTETTTIIFEVPDAKIIHLLYKKSTNGRGGQATVKINGTKLGGSMNSDFSGGWGDYADTFTVKTGTAASNCKIEITLVADSTKDEFTLLGILKS